MEAKFQLKGINMQFPLSGTEIILWLGVTAMLLLAASEFVSQNYGRVNLLIDKKRLRQATLLFTLLFLIYALSHIYEFFT